MDCACQLIIKENYDDDDDAFTPVEAGTRFSDPEGMQG